mmetsp:Transcript_21322/g.29889  ORF Transcript_21322/g.29889 Transcript_21322/m.29889 type:complete len:1175 (+) Transcript_21322:40-3564(+)
MSGEKLSKKTTSSSIKGGGNALLTPDVEEAILSLLYNARDSNNPLLPREKGCESKCLEDFNAQERKKEGKRFLKNLAKCHDKMILTKRINETSSDVSQHITLGEDTKTSALGRAECNSSSRKNLTPSKSSGKVRITIVEALYPKNCVEKKNQRQKLEEKPLKQNSNSDDKKNRKGKAWKEGSLRKTLVLPRKTSVKELLVTSMTKLRSKKKFVRCFYRDGKLEIDLIEDLSGLNDGSTIYLTSHGHDDDLENQNLRSQGSKVTKDMVNENEGNIIYQLDLVKTIYDQNRHNKSKELVQSPLSILKFSSHIENLPQLSTARKDLPASQSRNKILTTLDNSRIVIISGATGSGKSTQVPQYILEGYIAANCKSECNILVTQPRRVAATALAHRVASERGNPRPGKSGSEIGYNVRLKRATCKDTRIVYCTVGILLRMLLTSNREDKDGEKVMSLSTITHIIVDEVHERDLSTDFVLMLLRSRLILYPKLSLILMSATPSVELFLDYFSGIGAKDKQPAIIKIPGRTFPVEIFDLEDCEKITNRRLTTINSYNDNNTCTKTNEMLNETNVIMSPRTKSKVDNIFIVKLIQNIVLKENNAPTKTKNVRNNHFKNSGAILVFLPGKNEIESLAAALKENTMFAKDSQYLILKLYSSLPIQEQSEVFEYVKHDIIKIVLATNIAETSITIPDVSFVIDTGWCKESRFDPSSRINELVTVWISLASAKQRSGRAGRTGPGVCYRLYSKEFAAEKMMLQTCPEILRTSLDDLILQLLLYVEQHSSKCNDHNSSYVGASPVEILDRAPQPPPSNSILFSCRNLIEMGAVHVVQNEHELLLRLTPLGYHLSHLPMDAKVGKLLIVGCVLQCIEPALTIAAALSSSQKCWHSHALGSRKAKLLHDRIIEDGFGGANWKGGHAKGDLICVIAAYNSWSALNSEKSRYEYARENALDHHTLTEMKRLRATFRESLEHAGFLGMAEKSMALSNLEQKKNDGNALMTTCCLVAGLYPNIAILLRSDQSYTNREKRMITRERMITRDGISCKPSASSFQKNRVLEASNCGKDTYVVYHSKHQVNRTDRIARESSLTLNEYFLSEVNFVPRYSLLLFSGKIEAFDYFLIFDGWLKFRVGEKGGGSALLIVEFRKELENMILKHLVPVGNRDSDTFHSKYLCALDIIQKLLS